MYNEPENELQSSLKLLFALSFTRRGTMIYKSCRVPKGRSLETWSPEIFVVELGARSLSLLGARTEMLILAKWNPEVELDGALEPRIFWGPAFLGYRALGSVSRKSR